MKSKKCHYCGSDFFPRHANSNYCPGKNCVYEMKKIRSQTQYAVKSIKADLFWRNEKLLREFYSLYGQDYEIKPIELESAGFDFKLFSSERKINEHIIFCIRNFGYSFNENKTISIWKI